MPRKVDPALGQDGYERDAPSVRIEPTSLEPVFSAIGVSADKHEVRLAVAERVQEIADLWGRWKGRGASAFTREQAAAAIADRLSLSALSTADILSLNDRALQEVLHQLFLMPLVHHSSCSTRTEMLYRNLIDHRVLRIAAERALEQLKAQKGADRNGSLSWCTWQLCQLFENTTGSPATLSEKKELREYTAAPRSAAARFVHACFAVIDPTVPGRPLNSGIRTWIRKRRKPS